MTAPNPRIWEFAAAIGLAADPDGRAVAENPHASCPWDGRRLCGHTPDGHRVPDREYWHELGHACVALKRHWRLRGWGQGVVYDGTDGGPEYASRIAGEEPDASAVGILLQIHYGFDAEGGAEHAWNHDWQSNYAWDAFGIDGIARAMNHLRVNTLTHIRRRIAKRLRLAGMDLDTLLTTERPV